MSSKRCFLRFLSLCLALLFAFGTVANAAETASAPAPPPDKGRTAKIDDHGATIDPNG